MVESKITPLSIPNEGEEMRGRCRTLLRSPGSGAMIRLYPKQGTFAYFQYLLIRYRPSHARVKFSVREYADCRQTTHIGWYENGAFSTPYRLTDIDECWFLPVHSEGLEGIIWRLPVIFSMHMHTLEPAS